jgi:MinD superfamily P-loop ATPase
MRQLVDFFDHDGHRNRPELLIIDGPPIASANALTLASVVGGVVVVCAEGSGTTDDVKRSVGQLKSLGANVIGVVYNKAQNAESVPVDWAEPASVYTNVPAPRHLADGDDDPWPPRS